MVYDVLVAVPCGHHDVTEEVAGRPAPIEVGMTSEGVKAHQKGRGNARGAALPPGGRYDTDFCAVKPQENENKLLKSL